MRIRKPKLPTLREIMAQKKCSMNKARTFRAFMECDADTEYWRRTGRHFLEVITPEEFERDPSLAVR